MNFTLDQKIFVLQANGYEVRHEKFVYKEEYYRNAPEIISRNVWKVYKSGKLVAYDFIGKSDKAQVEELFNKIVYEKLTKFLAQ